MRIFDVAVVGSGPSGVSAALELAKSGLSTVIIEKETLPRYKTCGGGFVYRGLRNIPFDIASVVEREFCSTDVFFDSIGVKVTTERNFPIITMVMRDAFDNLIVEKAIENGAVLLQGQAVLNIVFDGTMQTIQTSEETIQAQFIIAADGALSPVAKMTGWTETRTLIPALEYEIEVPEADFERLSQTVRFDVDAVPMGYGWCFPKKNHLSIGVGVISKKNKKIDLKAHYRRYLATLGITTVIKEAGFGFVIPISPRTDGFVSKNVFLIGDAAGFADPIVAEGISNAILSGILAAKAIAESNRDAVLAAQLYQSKLDNTILKEVNTAALFSKLFYEKTRIRNLVPIKYYQVFAEALTDLFMGDRTYPEDYKAAIRRKLKSMIFS
ncbi:MAG: NAD(P)/FAD-dependent oxidoreductase [Flavobacterium sp.]|nr:NAD(P)/FAD-dependent oxidoreductase [Flavobacterium sp.]